MFHNMPVLEAVLGKTSFFVNVYAMAQESAMCHALCFYSNVRRTQVTMQRLHERDNA